MIDNTTLLKARVKMFNTKRQAGSVPLPAASKSQRRTSPVFKQYSEQARLILRDISELRDLVLDKRKEYILCSGSLSTYSFTTVMSEPDRLRFEHDSDTALKQCAKLVQFFQTQINSDRTLRRDDELNHLRLVSQLLDAYLRQICALIQQLRFIYRRQSERMRKICRLANLVEKYERSIDDAHRAENVRLEEAGRRRRNARTPPSDGENVSPLNTTVTEDVKKLGKSDIENRLELQLDAQPPRVRVYDFTSTVPRARVKESHEDGKTVAISDGWSELDDTTLFNDDANNEITSPPKNVTNPDSGCDLDRFAAIQSGDSEDDGWSDAELDFPTDGQSTTTSASNKPSTSSSRARQTKNSNKRLKGREEFSKTIAGDETARPTSDEDSVSRQLTHMEQEQLVIENRKLFDKFAHSDEDILHIGRQLTEIERLQNTFAEKVSEQEHEIDLIHTQTIYTLDNLEMANQFIRDAIKNSASRRVIALFCLIVLTFTLLFLDWYNP